MLDANEITRLEDLQAIVGGYIQAIPLRGGDWNGYFMIINEDAKLYPHERNQAATEFAFSFSDIDVDDYIAGVAIIVHQDAME